MPLTGKALFRLVFFVSGLPVAVGALLLLLLSPPPRHRSNGPIPIPILLVLNRQRQHPGRYQRRRTIGCAQLAVESCGRSNREQEAREIAAATLAPVLFPQLLLLEQATITATPEKALKKALRRIEHGALRARVSQLVLGTFIFRLRHEYVWNATHTANDNGNNDKVRAMVDLHAAYLLQDDDDDNTLQWPADPIDSLSVRHSMPRFLVQAWVAQYGLRETDQLCRHSNTAGPVTLRRNTLQCPSNEALMDGLFLANGVAAVPIMEASTSTTTTHAEFSTLPACLRLVAAKPPSIWNLQAWKDGWFEVQDAGSQWIVEACEVQPGETVVDYCAGNGGKTLALLSRVADAYSNTNTKASNSTTVIWAHDIVEARLAQLRGSLARVGVHSSIELHTTSAAADDLPTAAAAAADIVLVDAPCSSTGVLRRRPSQRWSLQPDQLFQEFPALQLEILQQAGKLVRPGGRLVYATCSVNRCENENVVAAWEDSVTDKWEPWPFSNHAPQTGTASHCRRFLPHTHDSDGFFVARWKRKI